jgi:hypothetical protein
LEYETCFSLFSSSHESPIINARNETDEFLGQATGLPFFQEIKLSTMAIIDQQEIEVFQFVDSTCGSRFSFSH